MNDHTIADAANVHQHARVLLPFPELSFVTTSKMPPPKHLENFLRLLLPPASREHVLGDLRERYTSPKAYLMEALSVLGPVIVSRIRRTTDFQVFLMETLTVYLSFTTAGWYLGEQSFLYDHAGFVRLAVPSSVAVVALLFCNAYSDSERKALGKSILQSAGSISLAFLGQAVVFDTQPSLAVLFRTLLYGSLLSLLLLSPLRILFPPVERRARFARPNARPFQSPQVVPASSLQQLRESVSKVQSRPKFNSVLAILALFTAALLLPTIWHGALPKWRFTFFAFVVLFVIYRIRTGE